MKSLTIINTFIIIVLSVALIMLVTEKKELKIGSIKNKQAFNEFALKKQMEKQLNHAKIIRQKILDSIYIDLDKMSKVIGVNRLEQDRFFLAKKEEYIQKRDQFEKENREQAEAYDKQIFTQLKQFSKEFAKKMGYDYLLTDDEEFSLMYAENNKDVTKDFIIYINQKYKVVK